MIRLKIRWLPGHGERALPPVPLLHLAEAMLALDADAAALAEWARGHPEAVRIDEWELATARDLAEALAYGAACGGPATLEAVRGHLMGGRSRAVTTEQDRQLLGLFQPISGRRPGTL